MIFYTKIGEITKISLRRYDNSVRQRCGRCGRRPYAALFLVRSSHILKKKDVLSFYAMSVVNKLKCQLNDARNAFNSYYAQFCGEELCQ